MSSLGSGIPCGGHWGLCSRAVQSLGKLNEWCSVSRSKALLIPVARRGFAFYFWEPQPHICATWTGQEVAFLFEFGFNGLSSFEFKSENSRMLKAIGPPRYTSMFYSVSGWGSIVSLLFRACCLGLSPGSATYSFCVLKFSSSGLSFPISQVRIIRVPIA